MSYLILARKYRPQTLDEVIGQDHIIQTLGNAMKEGRLAQSFLFVGTRGVGKTSTARIVAKILNCPNRKKQDLTPCNRCDSCREIADSTNLDVLEIDGASNRGIDEIRNLREHVKFKPTAGHYKIYIIDEVHMLTSEAFNALLKTLEEPPAHVKFIFATTESHRVPPTIISRCQRFDFKRIPTRTIAETLQTVAKKEKLPVDRDALFTIAKAAEGSMRDGESILDQMASYSDGKITVEATEKMLGLTKEETYFELVDAIAAKDSQKTLTILQHVINQGKDLRQFNKGLIEFFRDILIGKSTKKADTLIDRLDDSIKGIKVRAQSFTTEDVLYIVTVLQNLFGQLKHSTFPQINIEVALVKLTHREDMTALSEILERLAILEKNGGVPDMRSEHTSALPQSEKKVLTSAEPDTETRIKQKVDQYVKKRERPHNDDTHHTANKNSPPTLRNVEEQWTQILNEVKKKKMSAGIFLSDTEPIEVDGNMLILGLPGEFKFHKEALESKDNAHIIEQVMKHILGTKIKVQYVVTEKDSKEEVVDASSPEENPTKIIESAAELFRGKTIKK